MSYKQIQTGVELALKTLLRHEKSTLRLKNRGEKGTQAIPSRPPPIRPVPNPRTAILSRHSNSVGSKKGSKARRMACVTVDTLSAGAVKRNLSQSITARAKKKKPWLKMNAPITNTYPLCNVLSYAEEKSRFRNAPIKERLG
jgi:hypothetical protein